MFRAETLEEMQDWIGSINELVRMDEETLELVLQKCGSAEPYFRRTGSG